MVKLKKLYPFAALILLILGIVFLTLPTNTELNEDYINSDILMLEEESVEKILLKKDIDDSFLTLCSTDDNKLMLLFLDSEYELLFKLSFSPQKLSEDSNKVCEEKIPMSNKTLYYNVFLNPQQETIFINDNILDIHISKFQFNDDEYQIGFWYYVE